MYGVREDPSTFCEPKTGVTVDGDEDDDEEEDEEEETEPDPVDIVKKRSLY